MSARSTQSDPEGCGQQTEGQGYDEIDDFQDAVNGHTQDAERNQEQSDERVGNQGNQRERPAENEKNAPEQESEHG